jgi:hypothetical protein
MSTQDKACAPRLSILQPVQIELLDYGCWFGCCLFRHFDLLEKRKPRKGEAFSVEWKYFSQSIRSPIFLHGSKFLSNTAELPIASLRLNNTKFYTENQPIYTA